MRCTREDRDEKIKEETGKGRKQIKKPSTPHIKTRPRHGHEVSHKIQPQKPRPLTDAKDEKP